MRRDQVQAADATWTGGGAPDGNWQNANNWGGIAPLAVDALFFDGAVQTLTTNNFPADTVFGNITFNSSADAFSLAGNAVTLPTPPSVAYTGGSISNISFNVETVKLPLTLANGHHNIIGNAGGGTLDLAD